MWELGFFPHSAARKLAAQKMNTVGLLLTDIEGGFFTPMLSGIERASRQAGYDLLISTAGKTEEQDFRTIPIGPQNTDGMLVFAGSLNKGILLQLHKMNFPIVLIHQSSPEGYAIPCVTVENKAATARIVEHLIISHGRKRIVFLRGPYNHEDSHWREIGYKTALQNHGIAIQEELIANGNFNREVAKKAIANLIKREIQFDAVFSGDDEAAIGVLLALSENNIKVPEVVSVVGFDDQRMSAYLTPPLTTVVAPTEKVGSAATQQLLRIINKETPEIVTLISTEIIIRKSCGC